MGCFYIVATHWDFMLPGLSMVQCLRRRGENFMTILLFSYVINASTHFIDWHQPSDIFVGKINVIGLGSFVNDSYLRVLMFL